MFIKLVPCLICSILFFSSNSILYSERFNINSIESSASINTYPVENAFDDDINTTWACKKTNENEYVKLNFDKEAKIYGVYIASGYLKNNDTHKNNNRLKSLYFRADDQETAIIDLLDFRMPFDDYLMEYVDRYSMQFMYEGNSEFEAIKEEYKKYNIEITQKIESLFYPILFETPLTCTSLSIFITDIFEGDKYNEICISEIFPIIQNNEYTNPRLTELRDIGQLFEKIANNPYDVISSNNKTLDKITIWSADSIPGKGYVLTSKIPHIGLTNLTTIHYIHARERGHLIVWNGNSEYKENGASKFPFLFFQKKDNNFELIAKTVEYLGTIYEIMPNYINLDIDLDHYIFSVYDELKYKE